MKPGEMALAAEFVSGFADVLGNRTCDDHKLRNTQENRELCRAAAEHCEPGVEHCEVDPAAEWIIMSGLVLALYIAHKIRGTAPEEGAG